jgi:hypothetical protein
MKPIPPKPDPMKFAVEFLGATVEVSGSINIWNDKETLLR